MTTSTNTVLINEQKGTTMNPASPSTYKINLETTTGRATQALYDLDKSFIGTEDYMGLCFFWAYDVGSRNRLLLRNASVAQKKRVHKLLLEAGASTVSTPGPHWRWFDRSSAFDEIVEKVFGSSE